MVCGTTQVVASTASCTDVMDPNVSSLSVVSVSDSAASVFLTSTLYRTVAHWRLSKALVTSAVGATSLIATEALAKPDTGLLFWSCPETVTVSVTFATGVFEMRSALKSHEYWPPGSGNEAGLAVLTTKMFPVSTKTGILKVRSQLHFDGEPGAASAGVLQTPPLFWDQLVQFGRFNFPSPSLSWHRTLSTRTVTTLPFGLPHPASVLTSRHVSPSLFTPAADPSVTIPGEAGSV